MSRIAFLGLGQMGAPMAARLLDAGHDLTVWNRTRERAAPLAERGAVVASTPGESVAGAEIAVTMLATPEALEQVVLGPDGLASAMGPGQVLIDMSTVGPQTVRRVAAGLPDGVVLVDAPVRGSVSQATDGTLEIFAGATDPDFERVRPVLGSLGTVRHAGGPGSGAAVKLVVNLALGAAIVAVGEALALGDAMSLPREMLLDVLAESPLGPAVASKRASIASGRYPPRFKVRLAAKDLRLVTEEADRAGRDLPLARAARHWLDEAVEQGVGDLDYSAVIAAILGEAARD
jgi:3-hydroxyisobutyrate dehydrogenase-like beta-hydroxyacid dehydrogenase